MWVFFSPILIYLALHCTLFRRDRLPPLGPPCSLFRRMFFPPPTFWSFYPGLQSCLSDDFFLVFGCYDAIRAWSSHKPLCSDSSRGCVAKPPLNHFRTPSRLGPRSVFHSRHALVFPPAWWTPLANWTFPVPWCRFPRSSLFLFAMRSHTTSDFQFGRM